MNRRISREALVSLFLHNEMKASRSALSRRRINWPFFASVFFPVFTATLLFLQLLLTPPEPVCIYA